MPGFSECQFLAGATEFNGTAGQGLFSFERLDALHITTRILVTAVSYATQPGASGDVSIYVEQPTGTLTQRMLIARALQADMLGPAPFGNDFRSCSFILPRLPDSRFWSVVVFTSGKAVSGSVCIDWVISPQPDETLNDGPTL